MTSKVPALRQGIAVVDLLARHGIPVPAGAIMDELGLPRSTTYHLLAVLRDSGWVAHCPRTCRYRLGDVAAELGEIYRRARSSGSDERRPPTRGLAAQPAAKSP